MHRAVCFAAMTLLCATSALAQSSFDGVYRAPAGGVSGNARCGTTRFGYPLRVEGGVASLQTVSSGQLTGKVAPDGSISIQQGDAGFMGKISGKHFAGTFTKMSCQFDLQYDK